MTYREPPPSAPIVCATGQHVFGLDRISGTRVWQQSFEMLGSAVRLAFMEDRVFIGLSSGLACIHLETGEILWTARTHIPAQTMLVDRDRIVVGASGRVACFDLQGELLWRDDLKGTGIEPVALGVPGNVANADVR